MALGPRSPVMAPQLGEWAGCCRWRARSPRLRGARVLEYTASARWPCLPLHYVRRVERRLALCLVVAMPRRLAVVPFGFAASGAFAVGDPTPLVPLSEAWEWDMPPARARCRFP